jgi:hypothetical protein
MCRFVVIYAGQDKARHQIAVMARDACAAVAAVLRMVPDSTTVYVVKD